MDLLIIARKIWRYKFATLPVVVLTLFGCFYAVTLRKPVYETSSSYVLINPPAPPTPEEIDLRPALGKIKADNPYTRFSQQSVVVDLLSGALSSESARDALAAQGVDRRYTVEPTSEVGYSGFISPIVEITAFGESPELAVRSSKIVSEGVRRELDRLQKADGVDPGYWIRTQAVDAPDRAQLLASGKLRMVIGVLALGAVLLFVVVSVADALSNFRIERARRPAPSRLGGDEAWLARDESARDPSRVDLEDWSGLSDGSPRGAGPVDFAPDLGPEGGGFDHRPAFGKAAFPAGAARVRASRRPRGAGRDPFGDHAA